MTQRADTDGTPPRAEWSTERGTTSIVELSTTVVLISSTGHLDAESGERIGEAVDEFLRSRPRHLFFDMGQLQDYHPSVRKHLTQLFLAHRARVLSLHVLARSKLVRMGVSVARLALDMLVGHAEPETFNRALKAAVREGG